MDIIPNKKRQDQLAKILKDIQGTYQEKGGINHLSMNVLPDYKEVISILRSIIELIFPGYFSDERLHRGNLDYWSGHLLDEIYYRLIIQVSKSIRCSYKELTEKELEDKSADIVIKFLAKIPEIREALKTDVKAAYDGDPAAKSHEEVIISYPAIQAISMYRIAHELYNLELPLLPRMISEYAHMKTGIDIHPGAQIGSSFFIDHGTGVVIGETCVIGRNVKIYQMVTLGALSFKKDEDGSLIKGLRRHPTIEDNVILYAGCTILGGKTIIGRDSIIGGNVWITSSVPAGTNISFDVNQVKYKVDKK